RIIAALLLVLASAGAYAKGETVSFRLTPSGNVQAVVSGFYDDTCQYSRLVGAWSYLDTVTTTGRSITISYIAMGGDCFPDPIPPVRYEEVADLGQLTLPTYDVSWTTSLCREPSCTRFLLLSANLRVADLTGAVIPTMSPQSLITTIVLICLAFVYL